MYLPNNPAFYLTRKLNAISNAVTFNSFEQRYGKISAVIIEIENLIKQLFHLPLLGMRRLINNLGAKRLLGNLSPHWGST